MVYGRKIFWKKTFWILIGKEYKKLQVMDTDNGADVRDEVNRKQEGWLSPTEHASVSAISLRHILASPGYAPGTIAVNVTRMERGFNAGQTHRSMYPYIFNRFPVIQPVCSKVLHFSTFFAHFGLPWVRPLHGWKEDSMLFKRIAAYLQPFTSYSEILVGNCNFFLAPCI